VAISFAGPLVRFSTAPALAIAAWRLVISVAFIAVVLVLRGGFLRGSHLSRREWALAGAGGILLAGHFWLWTTAIQLTSIASTAVLVSTQPLFVGLLSIRFLGERPLPRQWAGIVLAVGGAGIIGWGDFGTGRPALLGDSFALLAAILAAGYFTIGRGLRRRMDLWAYTGVVYGICAAVLLTAVLGSPEVPAGGYGMGDWMVFLGLAAVPMMMGHTGINYALRYLPAYVANLASLGEPVGATLLAWVLPSIREVPATKTVAGGVLVLLGITLGTLGTLRVGGVGEGTRSGPDPARPHSGRLGSDLRSEDG
jgi:drug/metabolite transporter (DMT)-like permease